MSEAKIKIDGVVYDFPTQIRLGDAVLVRELTGVEVEDLEEAGNLTKLTAYLAIAVWQANPKWTRARVAQFVEQVDIESVETEGGEPDPPEPRVEEESPSPATSNGFTTIPADSWEDPASATSLASSGSPHSHTTSP
jgi:hypothetical protein